MGESTKWTDQESRIRFTNGQITTLITYLKVTAGDRENSNSEVFKDVDEILAFLTSEVLSY